MSNSLGRPVQFPRWFKFGRKLWLSSPHTSQRKSWNYIGLHVSLCLSVRQSLSQSVCRSFRQSIQISCQYHISYNEKHYKFILALND